jgi:hypothetical protein
MAAILSPLGLHGGNRKTKLPLRPNTRIHAPEGHFGKLMPDDRTWRSLNARHTISTRVLHFEVSKLRHRTAVKPVLLTGQTGTHRSNWLDSPVRLA